MSSAIASAFKSFDAFDFRPVNRLMDASAAYHRVSDDVQAEIALIFRPLKAHASSVMRPHSIRWSSGANYSLGENPIPALCGSVLPSAIPFIRAKGFYGNWPEIRFDCLVKTPDEFKAFWRAMRVTADALASSEIFEPRPDTA